MKAAYYYPYSLLFFVIILLITPVYIQLSGCGRIHDDDNDNNDGNKHIPEAVGGVLDLRGWDFTNGNKVTLDGEWEFYWQRLYCENDFASGNTGQPDLLINVPSVWNNNEVNGQILGGFGYATYRLRIKVSEEFVNNILTIFSPHQETSFLIEVNGDEVLAAGVVGSSAETSTPFNLFSTGSFIVPAEEFDIIVQVANFSFRSGGIRHSLQMGNEISIYKMLDDKRIQDTLILGILIAISIYYMIFYLYNRNDKTALYFSLLCLIIFFRQSVTGEKMLISILDFGTYRFFYTIEIITFFLSFPIILHFLYYLFYGNIRRSILRAAYVVSFPFVLMALLTPPQISSYITPVYMPAFLAGMIYILARITIMAFRKVNYANIILFGFIFIITASVNDVLYAINIIHTGFFVSYAVTVMILIQAGVLAIMFSRAFVDRKKAYQVIEELNKNLEYKISERTQKLSDTNTELTTVNKKLVELDTHKTEILNIVTHDLRTPVTSIVGFSRLTIKKYKSTLIPILEKVKDKKISRVTEQILSNISIIEEEGRRMSNLINNFLDLSKLEEGKVTLYREKLKIEDIINNAIKSVQSLVMQKKLKTVTDFDLELPEISGDREKLMQVVINLLSNAIKFTPAGTITCRAVREEGRIIVSIIDTGVGIAKEEQAKVFEKFQQVGQKDGLKQKGTGLGLPICKQIVELHEGQIRVKSEPGRGSIFSFSLPIPVDEPSPDTLPADEARADDSPPDEAPGR